MLSQLSLNSNILIFAVVGTLVTDIIHDVLEGVMQYEVRVVSIFWEKYFWLSFISKRVHHLVSWKFQIAQPQ